MKTYTLTEVAMRVNECINHLQPIIYNRLGKVSDEDVIKIASEVADVLICIRGVIDDDRVIVDESIIKKSAWGRKMLRLVKKKDEAMVAIVNRAKEV